MLACKLLLKVYRKWKIAWNYYGGISILIYKFDFFPHGRKHESEYLEYSFFKGEDRFNNGDSQMEE